MTTQDVFAGTWADPLGKVALLWLAAGLAALFGGLLFRPLAKLGATLLGTFARFWTGQIIWRAPSQWDARWESPAPELPGQVAQQRGQVYPYTRWGKRPGWQRQLVRVGVVALYVLWRLQSGVVITAAIVLVLVGVPAAAVIRHRRAAFRNAVGDFADALAERWKLDADPRDWIELPQGQWEQIPASLPLYGWLSSEHKRLRALSLGRKLAAFLERLSTTLAPAATWVAEHWQRPTWVPAVPLDHPDATITVHNAQAFNDQEEGSVKGLISKVANERIPGQWQVSEREHGTFWVLSHPARLPQDVPITAADLRKYEYPDMYLGTDEQAGPVVIDVKRKAPHASFSASTGWGKTTIANLVMGGQLQSGAFGVLLDPKRIGYVGSYRALPNVVISVTVDGWKMWFERVLDEMDRRYEVIEEFLPRAAELGLPNPAECPEKYFQPLFLLDDEKGSLTVALKQDWKEQGEKGTPLALVQDQQILWRGRAAAVHRITLAQQNNLEVFLNSDMRDQYMVRVLAGPQTPSSWRMTFPGTKQKKIGNKKGRAVFGIGPGEQRGLQLGNISDVEARKAAQNGVERMEKENQERAELLAKLTDTEPWTVSPCAHWMRGAAQTAPEVPVPDEGTGTETSTRENANTSNTAPDLRVFVGGGEPAEEPIFAPELFVVPSNVPGADEAPQQTSGEINSDDPEYVSGDSSESVSGPEIVLGMAAAAQALGYNGKDPVNAFKKARQRAIADGNPIPTETRQPRGLQWERVALEEWHAQLPRAGAGAVRNASDLPTAAGDE